MWYYTAPSLRSWSGPSSAVSNGVSLLLLLIICSFLLRLICEIVENAFIMVINGDRQHFLGPFLTDDMAVQVFKYL